MHTSVLRRVDALLARPAVSWSRADLELLLTAPTEAGPGIAAAADSLARRRHGDQVTYVVNRNVNFTNHCSVRCFFCAFHRPEHSPDAFRLSVGDVVERVASTPEVTELCIQGGIDDAFGLSYYEDLLAALKRWKPSIHLHAFSPQEIWSLSEREAVPVDQVLERLRGAGLDSMPGTAAEILVPRVRDRVSPRRVRADDWAFIVETAHGKGLRTSATMMFGHLESPAERAEHMQRIRRLQELTGGFTEFVPMPFLAQDTALGRAKLVLHATELPELARVTAVSRLFFDDVIGNIQASWVKAGHAGAVALLQAGANDLGGTLYEESISRLAGGSAGEYMAPEDFHRLAGLAGRKAVERTTLYERVEVH